jgi:hypothetical protein
MPLVYSVLSLDLVMHLKNYDWLGLNFVNALLSSKTEISKYQCGYLGKGLDLM